jgi:hypothetical protein
LAHSLDTQTGLQRHLEFRCERLLVKDTALPASSLDFLLGTSEKNPPPSFCPPVITLLIDLSAKERILESAGML